MSVNRKSLFPIHPLRKFSLSCCSGTLRSFCSLLVNKEKTVCLAEVCHTKHKTFVSAPFSPQRNLIGSSDSTLSTPRPIASLSDEFSVCYGLKRALLLHHYKLLMTLTRADKFGKCICYLFCNNRPRPSTWVNWLDPIRHHLVSLSTRNNYSVGDLLISSIAIIWVVNMR